MKTQVKNPAEITAIRASGKILATILSELEKNVQPGVTTLELDAIAAKRLQAMDAKAAFKGFNGFPAHICISVNEEIVHGIPDSRVIEDGDLVCLDFGVLYDGMITDSAITVPVGAMSKSQNRLLDYTQRALYAGIDTLRDGVRLGDIGAAISSTLRQGNLTVIETLCGHGVGHEVHEDPAILNYGTPGTGESLKAGMTIALEPIASLGSGDIHLAADNWTYVTNDKSLSAQFEHTILITQDGAEILTSRND